MSLFKKANKDVDRLKMYIYGLAGTGKTLTSLHFPSPAVIDTERGTDHYGDSFDFFRLQTSDLDKIHGAIDELLENPDGFKTCVIDPLTVVCDQIIRKKEEYMKMKTGNINYELQPLDYKSIKTEIKILMNKLLSLDMNVICTARSKPLYNSSGKNFMEQIGYQPEGHKDLPYMFDIVLELYKDEEGNRKARVEKDRTNKLPHVFDFTYDSFVEYIGIDALERDAKKEKQRENINKANERTTKISFNGNDIYTAGITSDTLKSLQVLAEDFKEEDLKETLKEEYEVESLLDLDEKAGLVLLEALETHKLAEKQETETDNQK